MAQHDSKVAFISGANRGIGLETARKLGELGIAVVLGVRDPDKGAAAVRELAAEGIRAEAIRYDAADDDAPEAVYRHLEQRYGKLDILVNNAGILREPLLGPNSSSSVSQQVLRETFQVNLFAVIALTQKLLPLLRQAPAGRIVNLSSIVGSLTLHSQPDSPIAPVKSVAYDASKSALNAYTIHLAHELRETPIKVNSAHPGWVRTELGGEYAPMDVADSWKTSVRLATLEANGPSGGFFHEADALPW